MQRAGDYVPGSVVVIASELLALVSARGVVVDVPGRNLGGRVLCCGRDGHCLLVLGCEIKGLRGSLTEVVTAGLASFEAVICFVLRGDLGMLLGLVHDANTPEAEQCRCERLGEFYVHDFFLLRFPSPDEALEFMRRFRNHPALVYGEGENQKKLYVSLNKYGRSRLLEMFIKKASRF